MTNFVNPYFNECISNVHKGKMILDELNLRFRPKNTVFHQENSLFYYTPSGIRPQDHIAMFDVDWTITYSQQHLFPKNEDDIFILPGRRKELMKLFKSGFTLVFVTNQFAKSAKEKMRKVERMTTMIRKLEIPCYMFIATGKDGYRKPELGIWEKVNELIPNIRFAVYCGDAAGRPQDFAASDREFADNAGIPFYTPEEFFPYDVNVSLPNSKNIVIFVGMPGSGKTAYYNENFARLNYVHINQDTLKTKANVKKKVMKAFNEGENMVIDSTNPSQEKRQVYYNLANEYNYAVTVIYFVRNGTGWNAIRAQKVPAIVYHIYFKNLVPPSRHNTPGELFLIP